ncbi:MAG: TonB-dependent receptor [Rhodospirillaceae bacterium]|nr:TonB-dependent receptor [Rhodospirillaceae bacterium]
MYRRCVLHTVAVCALIPYAASAASNTTLEVEEVFVTSTPIERSLADIIQGASVLTGDDLRDRVQFSLGETLRGEIGVSSTFFGPVASRPIIRGQGGDRIRVLTNGVDPVDASVTSVDHQVSINPGTTERIEILRGPNTLLYGSNAVGGIVNVIDTRIATTMPEQTVSGRGDLSYGTNADLFSANAQTKGQIGPGLVLSLDGSYSDQSDYEIDGFANEEAEEEGIDGLVENSAAEVYTIGGGLSHLWEDGHIGVSGGYFNSFYGVPAAHGHEEGEEDHDDEDHDEEEHGEEEEEESIAIDLERVRFDVDGELRNLGSFLDKATFRFGYGDYDHTEFESQEVGTIFRKKAWEGRLEFVHRPVGNLEGAFGVQLRNRDFEAIGDEAFVPPTETDSLALFFVEEASFDAVTLSGGLRYETVDVASTTTNTERDFDTLSWSIGAAWQFADGVTFGLTTSQTERAPNAEELFSNGPHLATQQFEVGDLNLVKEKAWNAEANLKVVTDRFGGALNLFRTEYDDYIFERETGLEEDELPLFQYTQVEATFSGVEVETDVEVFRSEDMSVLLEGSLSYVKATDDETDSPLPRIPPLFYTVGATATVENWTARIEVEGSSSASRLAPLEEGTDSYTFVNAQVSWKPIAARDVRLTLQGRNLGNSFARPHTSFIKELTPLPGRDIRFSVGVGF